MKGWLARRGAFLIPTDEYGEKVIASMGQGECLEFELVRPRSVQWHRMYFGICRTIGLNQDPPRDESSIDYELRVRAGHYDVLIVGHDDMVEKIAAALDSAVASIREHAAGLETLASLLSGLALKLHERAEKFEVRIPKRIAFAKLSGPEWSELWPSIELAIRETFGEEYVQEAAAG